MTIFRWIIKDRNLTKMAQTKTMILQILLLKIMIPRKKIIYEMSQIIIIILIIIIQHGAVEQNGMVVKTSKRNAK